MRPEVPEVHGDDWYENPYATGIMVCIFLFIVIFAIPRIIVTRDDD